MQYEPFVLFCPMTWMHEPVHAVDSMYIATSRTFRKEDDGERCSNNLIRRTTRTFRSSGRRARHRIDCTSLDGPSSPKEKDLSATRSWRSAPISLP